MKKIILVSLCSALSLSVISTGFKLNNTTKSDPLSDHAVIISQPVPSIEVDTNVTNCIALVEKMDTLAESKEYVKAISESDVFNDIISTIGDSAYTTPKAIYKSIIPKDTISNYLSNLEISNASEDIESILGNKLIASIPNQINAVNGASELAATSILSLNESYFAKEINEPTIYILLYDNDYSAIVTLIPGSGGSVFENASFVKTENFKEINKASDLNNYFKTNLLLEKLDFNEVSMS